MGNTWEKIIKNRFVILFLLIGTVYFFLQFLVPLLSPILTAMLFVTIFGPFLKKLQRRLHIHRQVGAVILLLAMCMLMLILGWVLFSWILGSLPDWVMGLETLGKELSFTLSGLCQGIGKTLGVDSIYLQNILLGNLMKGLQYLRDQLIPGMLSHSFQYVQSFLAFGGFLITFVITAVLMAKDYDEIMNELLDREDCHLFLEVICGIIRYIATFIKAQGMILSVNVLLCSFCLRLAGIPNGILWGVLAGLLDVLPFVGTGIVLIPLGISQIFRRNLWGIVWCFLLYVTCIIVREFLEPRLIGKKMGISPIAVLGSIYAGIGLFGVSGILKGPLGFVIVMKTYQSIRRRFLDIP